MYFKDVRFYTTENLNKLKAGKSDNLKPKPNFDNFSDAEDETQTVNEEIEITNDEEENEVTDDVSNYDSDEINNDSDDASDPFKTSTEDRGEPQTVTKSGRISYAPKFMLYSTGKEEDNMDTANAAFSKSELEYYNALKEIDDFDGNDLAAMTGSRIKDEIALIGAGVGGGFNNTKELHVMKYKEAMATSKKKEWEQAVK